jgi:hypothetical protein
VLGPSWIMLQLLSIDVIVTELPGSVKLNIVLLEPCLPANKMLDSQESVCYDSSGIERMFEEQMQRNGVSEMRFHVHPQADQNCVFQFIPLAQTLARPNAMI